MKLGIPRTAWVNTKQWNKPDERGKVCVHDRCHTAARNCWDSVIWGCTRSYHTMILNRPGETMAVYPTVQTVTRSLPHKDIKQTRWNKEWLCTQRSKQSQGPCHTMISNRPGETKNGRVPNCPTSQYDLTYHTFWLLLGFFFWCCVHRDTTSTIQNEMHLYYLWSDIYQNKTLCRDTSMLLFIAV